MRGLKLLVLTAVTPMAASHAFAATDPLEANKAVVRAALHALEQGDLPAINQVYDPKGPIHTSKGVVLQGGPSSTLKEACPMCARLSDRQIKIVVMLAEGDLVSVRSTWSGRYTGGFFGKAIVNQPVSMVYTNIYRVRDGRIVENWYAVNPAEVADELSLKLVAQ
jgi:predicted ester cyclase